MLFSPAAASVQISVFIDFVRSELLFHIERDNADSIFGEAFLSLLSETANRVLDLGSEGFLDLDLFMQLLMVLHFAMDEPLGSKIAEVFTIDAVGVDLVLDIL